MLIQKKHPVLKEYLGHEFEKMTEIRQKLIDGDSHSERVVEIQKKLERMTEVLKSM